MESVTPHFRLDSLLLIEDVERDAYLKSRGTMRWAGTPSLLWSVIRGRGMAVIFAQWVLSWGIGKGIVVAGRFDMGGLVEC
jgi:hypothetical protein